MHIVYYYALTTKQLVWRCPWLNSCFKTTKKNKQFLHKKNRSSEAKLKWFYHLKVIATSFCLPKNFAKLNDHIFYFFFDLLFQLKIQNLKKSTKKYEPFKIVFIKLKRVTNDLLLIFVLRCFDVQTEHRPNIILLIAFFSSSMHFI